MSLMQLLRRLPSNFIVKINEIARVLHSGYFVVVCCLFVQMFVVRNVLKQRLFLAVTESIAEVLVC